MKAKNTIIMLFVLLSLCACTTQITNLTPENVATTSSEKYTISMKLDLNDGAYDPGTLKVQIVIDGNIYSMHQSSVSDEIYEFDYIMPRGRTQTKYYFLVEYKTDRGKNRKKQSSEVKVLQTTKKYAVSILEPRAVAGAEVVIVGRGFDNLDKVLIDDLEVDTKFNNKNSISFILPPLPANKTYAISIQNQDEFFPAGFLKVDTSSFRISPDRIYMQVGDEQLLLMDLGFEAPAEGIEISVATNVPSSIKMPTKIVVSPMQRTINIPVKAIKETPNDFNWQKGKIFFNAEGFREGVVEITIK